MPSRAVIRMMGPDDLREVFLLGQKTGYLGGTSSPFWNENDLADALIGGFDFSFVAVKKKAIIGFIIACRVDSPEEGPILSIPWFMVTEQRDTPVIRQQFFHALAASISDSGIERVTANCNGERKDMINFFKEKGFTSRNTVLVMEASVPTIIKGNSKL